MKRILVALLTAIVVFSAFPVTTLAAIPPAYDPPGYPGDPESAVPYAMTGPTDANGWYDILDDKFIDPFTPIVVGREQNTLVIPIKENFTGTLASGVDDRATLTINDLELHFRGDGSSESQFRALFGPHHTAIWYPDMDHAQFELAPQNIGIVKGWLYVQSRHYGTRSQEVYFDGQFIDPTINKEIIALSGQNLAMNGGVATGYADYNTPGGQVLLNGRDFTGTDLVDTQNKLNDMGAILSGSELAFRLDTEHFDWDPDILDMVTAVRKSTMDVNGIGTYAQYYGGRTAIEEVVIENILGRAYVIVRFRDDFPILEEKEFYFDLYLTYRGKRHNDTMVTIGGTVENDILYIYGDDETADISAGGMMIEAVGACRNTEIKLNEGLSIFADLDGGKRYYAKATTNRDVGDLEIIDYFPEIKKAFTITSAVNIPNDAMVELSYVEYDDDGLEIREEDQTVYYVYDANGDLIGTSDIRLPMRRKYYLASKELIFDDGGFEVIYAGHGGWDEPSNNPNYNPGTGR